MVCIFKSWITEIAGLSGTICWLLMYTFYSVLYINCSSTNETKKTRAQLRQKNQDRLIVSYKKNRWSKCSQCSMEGIVIWRAHLVTIKTEQSRTIAPISSLSSVVPSCWCWRVACTRSERASRCIPSMRRRYTQNRLPALSRRIDLNGSFEALWGRHLNSTLVFPLAW
jgi:hypothetical protein